MNIVVAESLSEDAVARLAAVGRVRTLTDCNEEALRAAVVDCDALVVRSYARVTADLIAAGSRLKVIGRAGIGLDNIDIAAARACGVPVVHTPAASTNAVAEHTVGLMLALERHVVRGDAMVRSGQFLEARGAFVSRELRGLTLGIVGMGRIGSAVGRICHDGLGMRILYNDIREIGGLSFEAATAAPDDLYAAADVVTLHVPLTAQTTGMIGPRALARVKATATLVNTARGAVVDIPALAEALRDGRLAGAAIDTHSPEPPPPPYALFDAPNCLLSPHVGGRTAIGLAGMNDVVDDVIAVLSGEEPAHPAW